MSAERPVTEDDLQGYVDRVLEGRRREEVARYLDRHPEVARRIAGYAAQRAALREALAPFAEEPVPPELSLARTLEARRHPRTSASWRAAAAASVLLLGLGGAGGWALRGVAAAPAAGSGIAALAREAADSYEVYATDRARPVEIRAPEQDQLVRWVSSRLRRPIGVPDLAGSGYRFMGGRLVATPHGPAGLFLYDDDRGTRLAVMVRPMAVETNTPMSQHVYGPVAGFAWADRGLGYSLVAAAPAPALHPLADEVRRQMDRRG
jgi:anti-sigma factor RsiW